MAAISKFIFLNEKVQIFIQTSLKCFPSCSIINKSALVQIMVWRRPGDKSLSEPMIIYLTDAYVCVCLNDIETELGSCLQLIYQKATSI